MGCGICSLGRYGTDSSNLFFLLKKIPPPCVSPASPRLALILAPLPTDQKNLKNGKFGLENAFIHFQPSLEEIDSITEVTQGTNSS